MEQQGAQMSIKHTAIFLIFKYIYIYKNTYKNKQMDEAITFIFVLLKYISPNFALIPKTNNMMKW